MGKTQNLYEYCALKHTCFFHIELSSTHKNLRCCFTNVNLVLLTESDFLLLCSGRLKVVIEDNLGVIDFHPSNEAGVIYVSETDLVAGSNFKQKIAKLRKVRFYAL